MSGLFRAALVTWPHASPNKRSGLFSSEGATAHGNQILINDKKVQDFICVTKQYHDE
jgi:hypothetical protein